MIFLKTFEDWTLHGTLSKEKVGKIAPKHVQNTFGQFWERFWAFLEFWKFFDFSEIFRRLDPPRNIGQKKFSEKLPQNMFKTRLNTIGNDFGPFWIFEENLIFLKTFEDSTLHGTLVEKKISEKLHQNMFKTRLDTFRNDFGHFWNFENF